MLADHNGANSKSTKAVVPFRDEDWEENLRNRYPQEAQVETEAVQLEVEEAVKLKQKVAAEQVNASSEPSAKTVTASDCDCEKSKVLFRQYEEAPQHVKDFYRINHQKQTLEFVLGQKEKYRERTFGTMHIWEALERLNELVDESDPDTSVTQIMHALQSAEAARKDGQPRWLILTVLIHDLGKILYFYGEPQWAVVGDTFPVGCAFSDKIVYPTYFDGNPDSHNPQLNTKYGIYEPQCGLDQVHMSWGHDEYLYSVVKEYLPAEAAYIIRYHSFYAAHRENEYQHLMNNTDVEMMKWVRVFNPYDLYSKADKMPDVELLKPYYTDLIQEFFPNPIPF